MLILAKVGQMLVNTNEFLRNVNTLPNLSSNLRKTDQLPRFSQRVPGAPTLQKPQTESKFVLIAALGPVHRIRTDIFPVTPASFVADVLLRTGDAVLHANWIVVGD